MTAAGADPALLNRSFEACRRKGRVVLVGDVPIRIQRDRIYKKELDFLISTSYGPGRYDAEYEEKGHDYPFGYVRWTEGRNLAEVLRLMASGGLSVRPLIDAVYEVGDERPTPTPRSRRASRPLGVVLRYGTTDSATAIPARTHLSTRAAQRRPGSLRVGVIGYGSYFRSALLPLLKTQAGRRARLRLRAQRADRAQARSRRTASSRGTTDYREMLADPDVDVVYVATRHDQHYPIACAAVEAGKAVFVEKPMTMTAAEGRDLVERVARRKASCSRSGSTGVSLRTSSGSATALAPIAGPKTMLYRVNAGPLSRRPLASRPR